MDHTGSNVYKGMVGLYPIYDPKNGMDMGDERQGLRLPGVRTDNPDGSFDVEYDIPLAFFDCRLDDGVTTHKDIHDDDGVPGGRQPARRTRSGGARRSTSTSPTTASSATSSPSTAPPTRCWSQAAQVPVPLPRRLDLPDLRVQADELDRRARSPRSRWATAATSCEGQYRIPDGQQCMKFTQIASDGGLLPFPITRDSFELWPAKRREVIVDFTKYQDGTPDHQGRRHLPDQRDEDADGRMWTNSSRFAPDPDYKVPVLKFVIGDDAPEDNSLIPARPAAAAICRRCRATGRAAGQPPDLRGRARHRRRRDRVADQRRALRPDHGRRPA